MAFIPESPNTYQGNQVIINSDRLIFNAKQDAILLYSDKAIGFVTKGNFHFDTSTKDAKFIVNSPEIYLGLSNITKGKLASQPAVLGHRLENLLEDILFLIENVTIDACFNISGIVTTHGDPTGMNPKNFGILFDRFEEIKEIRNRLTSIRSKKVKLV